MIDFSLRADPVVLRPWRATDRAALVAEANHREVWRNLTNRFPHPYTLRDAVQWIDQVSGAVPPQHFAVLVDERVVGGAGAVPIADYGNRAAEVGYWLGPQHWGRGLATTVVNVLVPYAFATLGVIRLHATVFGWNLASVRVLEKNGFSLEGRLRHAVAKDGEITDLLVFGLVIDEYAGGVDGRHL